MFGGRLERIVGQQLRRLLGEYLRHAGLPPGTACPPANQGLSGQTQADRYLWVRRRRATNTLAATLEHGPGEHRVRSSGSSRSGLLEVRRVAADFAGIALSHREDVACGATRA